MALQGQAIRGWTVEIEPRRTLSDGCGALRSGRSHVAVSPIGLEKWRSGRGRGRRRAVAEVGPAPLRRKAPVREVLLVDPLAAKRMAEEDMQRRLKKAAHQRQRVVEATNGGWAALGLTAGIVAEGATGRGIIAQVASYLDFVTDFLNQFAAV